MLDCFVFFMWVDGYVVWVNSKVMVFVGIIKDILFFVGGEIFKDLDGNFIGVFIDNVVVLIEVYLLLVSSEIYE